ncbi:unconventional myosin-XIX-like isoform X2 [Homarus americanus]|uniref:unconventional myosin-XIX-like isoform X2 n=1 Tax=Homarus americanus TaxID=6706 RepID=UPI001C459339|nr:unconventional myosin-XIX-like isoform X2 [Homarus americanus]
MDDDDSNVTTHGRSRKIPPPVPKKKLKKAHVTSEVKYDSSSQESLLSDSFLSVPREELVACDDLTRLPILYDDIVLECIILRYNENAFYTWAGPTLVAANPCRSLDHLYTLSQIEHHHDQVKSGLDRRDAHVYSIAGVAHHRLTHDLGCINQAVLVSGESGAGKTISARYMLGYLTHVETKFPQVPRSPLKGVWEDKEPEDILNRILASDPILEAFGNSATLRNENSSRFGKLIRLQYGGRQLRGAEIDTYLLEKTRVTHQSEEECNFHIFDQVVAGIRSGIIKDLMPNIDEKVITLSIETIDSDLSNLQETLQAFNQLNFSQSHQIHIFQVIVALLHLRNITFAQDDGGQNKWTVNKQSKECMESLRVAAFLLGLNEDKLVDTLTIHTFSVSSARKVNVFHKPCERLSQCVERRDALMQLIYQSLFLHIVKFINGKISAPRNIWSNFLGILDVYGFETFEQNSLEQLCINYTNERLQQAFMLRYLATEHQILKEEGFLGVDVPYTDNSLCVMTLDSRISVFAILNELKRDVKEDEACDRVCKALADTGVVYAPFSPRDTPGFVINHYAGPVKYDAQGLLHKNKDEVPYEVWGLLASSSQDFIRNLTVGTDSTDLENGRRTTRKITTLSKFKSSLDNLMKTLSECDLHYVRCIKPSMGAHPGEVERDFVLNQLRACGVIETVSISQAGYPVRISHEDFYNRYGGSRKITNVVDSSIAVAKSVLGVTPEQEIDPVKCRFGRTRVFLSESALHALEKVREDKRHQAATCLQKCWRRYICLRQYKKYNAASCTIQKNVKSWLTSLKYKKLKYACVYIQKNMRRYVTHKKYMRLCKATITIQKYCRGWSARRKYEAMLQQAAMRPYSRQSVVSMNSLGYYSLTTSTSIYSLNPSLHDVSPCDIAFGDMAAVGLSGEALKAYFSPEHHRRLLETEESGIETDTESINGDTDQEAGRRSRKLRRRAQLRDLRARIQAKINRVASEESLVDVPNKSLSQKLKLEDSNCEVDGEAKPSLGLGKSEKPKKREENLFPTTFFKNTKNSSDERERKQKPKTDNISQRMRVATMRTIQEVSGILKDYSPSESLQMVLPKQNLSLFFKDGVLSYRRMPLVAIKFHTRPTCLPFSHHLPYREQPHGLWDALH